MLIKSLEPGTPMMIESVHRKKDGSILPIQIRIGLIKIHGKTHLLSLASDITERKRVEETLKESDERYRCLFDNSPIGIG